MFSNFAINMFSSVTVSRRLSAFRSLIRHQHLVVNQTSRLPLPECHRVPGSGEPCVIAVSRWSMALLATLCRLPPVVPSLLQKQLAIKRSLALQSLQFIFMSRSQSRKSVHCSSYMAFYHTIDWWPKIGVRIN